MWYVAVAFWSEEDSWRRGPQWPIFAPPWIRPGRIWQKNNNTCKGPWVLHLYQVSSKSISRFWKRSWKYDKFMDGRRRTTTTDDALWQKLTRAFGSGWLKRRKVYVSCTLLHVNVKKNTNHEFIRQLLLFYSCRHAAASGVVFGACTMLRQPRSAHDQSVW